MSVSVSLQNACKIYNKIPVINDLSFTIEAGEMFGLLGPNGAGKSTTIRMLTTLTKPSSGQIQVAGFDVMRQSLQVKQCIGEASCSNKSALIVTFQYGKIWSFTGGCTTSQTRSGNS
ncbi:ATP-binding cassette domain-containing protein [Microcoleus sp. S13_C5]|uniref:ATP-binding cassette domain-containing protein n=1 Tax=Microcoleus sp. S13_C5 TaxID=3055411 RepID=UPI00403FA2B1